MNICPFSKSIRLFESPNFVKPLNYGTFQWARFFLNRLGTFDTLSASVNCFYTSNQVFRICFRSAIHSIFTFQPLKCATCLRARTFWIVILGGGLPLGENNHVWQQMISFPLLRFFFLSLGDVTVSSPVSLKMNR